jgi:hypothetical protein
MFRPTLKHKLSYRILLQVNMASEFVSCQGNSGGIWNPVSGWKVVTVYGRQSPDISEGYQLSQVWFIVFLLRFPGKFTEILTKVRLQNFEPFLQDCRWGFVHSGTRDRVIEYSDIYSSSQRRVSTFKARRSGSIYPVTPPHAPEKLNPPITTTWFQTNLDHFYNLLMVAKRTLLNKLKHSEWQAAVRHNKVVVTWGLWWIFGAKNGVWPPKYI